MHAVRFAALLLALPLPALAQAPASPLNGPLTLSQAIRLGRERGVDAALARIGASGAGRKVALRRADLLPQIDGSASLTRQTLNLDEFGLPIASGVTDPFSIYRLQVRASQVLFNASTIERLRAAGDSAAAAGLDARSVGELTAATAGLAYLRAQSTVATVHARQADSAVSADLLHVAQQQFDAGVSPVIDVTRNQVNFAAVRAQLVIARNDRDQAMLDLKRALNLPPAEPLALADSLLPAPEDLPVPPDSAVEFALGHRPEMAAEHRRTQVVERSLKAIKYENLPSLAASGFYQQSGQSVSGLAGSWNVQIGLAVPLFDGLRRPVRAQEQSLRLEAQRIREQDLARQVETEVRKALLDLGSARQQVDLAQERLQLALQELDQANQRFRAGVAGSVETTNAQGSVIAARDGLIQAEVRLGSARVTAYRALGILDQVQ